MSHDERYRPLLFSIAYRMVGSVMDAEDLVQEAFLRWQQVDQAAIQSPKSFLTTVLTRLCLDHLKSARVRREQYVGPWLPEPLLGEAAPDVAGAAVAAESLSLAFLLVLERLTPVERAVFLLHDVFGYDFAEVARFVDRTPAHCRQIALRARRRVREERPGPVGDPRRGEQLAMRFVQACTAGDLPGLLALLTDEITLWTDGGGKVRAALKPLRGPDAVARFLFGVLRKAPAGMSVEPATVNGGPGLLVRLDGRLYGVLALDPAGERIRGLQLVTNPDKLRHLAAP